MKDYIIRGMDQDQQIKIGIIHAPMVVEEGRVRHNLSPTATAALGRALCGGLLMAGYLKNPKDSLSIHVDGDGDIGKILVTGKNDGKIKGYVTNPNANAPLREDGKLDVGRIVGSSGHLTVVMDLGMKEPYVGQVPLVNGEIAEDLANYFLMSEQVPSAISLGVMIDKEGKVTEAGGFLIQRLPGASDEVILRLEEKVKELPPITKYFEMGRTPEDLFHELLPNVEILERQEVSFSCECNREKVKDSLLSLGYEQLDEILKEDKKAELTCYFCGDVYQFNEEELEDLVKKSKDINKK
ncbi:MAG: Hsp33 family molecular chaperone HslO [Tissierellia bacterium]|nr:Hsp33 family molecular chaperone HslO [Tissierellia bacterium]